MLAHSVRLVRAGGRQHRLFAAAAVQRQPARQKHGTAMSAAAGGETGVVVVFCAVPSKDVGLAIARSLVESKLAACVNVLPGVESVYFWDGKVQTDAELLLKIKTRKALLPQLTTAVQGLHPCVMGSGARYDVPEVVAVDAVGGSDKYLSWVLDSTKPPT